MARAMRALVLAALTRGKHSCPVTAGGRARCRLVVITSVRGVHHLAIPVRDHARRDDDDVLMLYDASGFALALAPPTAWMHFGVGLPDRDAVPSLRDRFAADGVDPDGHIVEASWEPPHG
jgi:hypothetical protein